MRIPGGRAWPLAAAWLWVAAGEAGAEARPYPPGVGSVSLALQAIDNTGHRLTDGSLLNDGKSVSRGFAVEVGYGVTERLSVTAGLPFIAAKYRGPGPTPADLPVDSGRQWHSSLQDFGLHARYNALSRGPLALTPGLGVVLPSHAYNYQGEAVAGRRLREVQLELSGARTLEELTPRLEIEAAYAYAFVEKGPAGLPNNRSNASLDLSYLIGSRWQAHGAVLWQRTHGGLRFGSFTGSLPIPGEVNTPLRFAEHDRLLRDDNVRLEGGVACSLGAVDVFAGYLGFVSGTDTHAGRAVTLGATWFFGRLPGPK